MDSMGRDAGGAAGRGGGGGVDLRGTVTAKEGPMLLMEGKKKKPHDYMFRLQVRPLPPALVHTRLRHVAGEWLLLTVCACVRVFACSGPQPRVFCQDKRWC